LRGPRVFRWISARELLHPERRGIAHQLDTDKCGLPMPNSGIAYLTSTMHDGSRIPEKGDEQAMNTTIGGCSKSLLQDRPAGDGGETERRRRDIRDLRVSGPGRQPELGGLKKRGPEHPSWWPGNKAFCSRDARP
jgi:hypothetical protein